MTPLLPSKKSINNISVAAFFDIQTICGGGFETAVQRPGAFLC